MSSLSKKLLLILIPALVLLIGCAALLVLLPGQNNAKPYVEQIRQARSLAESGDYDKAIVYYLQAIETDETNEDGYYELADIYFMLGRDEDAIALLQKGYEKTQSDRLLAVLSAHNAIGGENPLGGDNGGKKNNTPAVTSVEINSVVSNVFLNYNFEKYSSELTVQEEHPGNGLYTVVYAQYDAEFEYKDNADSTVINPDTGKPFPYAKPTAIRLTKPELMFAGIENGFSYEQLKQKGCTSVKVGAYDANLKCNLLTFDYQGLSVTLACDENGNVKGSNVYNVIVPPAGKEEKVKYTFRGNVVDATTGTSVASADIKIHEGKGSTSGEVVESMHVSGAFSVDLYSGDYTLEVQADGYNPESFNFYVSDSSANAEQTFTISPSLGANEIRFVLEWGSAPRDVDSHLEGTYKNQSVNVNFMYKTARVNNEIVADLDVDDQDGFGPETLTLHKTGGTFEYKVHRYFGSGTLAQSGATVKIYTSDSSTPITVSVPADLDGDWWTVCTVENGTIKNING